MHRLAHAGLRGISGFRTAIESAWACFVPALHRGVASAVDCRRLPEIDRFPQLQLCGFVPLIFLVYPRGLEIKVWVAATVMRSLLARARDLTQQPAPKKAARVAVGGSVVVATNAAHFADECGCQRSLYFKGPCFKNFLRFVQGQAPEMLRRDGGLGVASTGHRFKWGSRDNDWESVWSWSALPVGESAIMTELVVQLLGTLSKSIRVTADSADVVRLCRGVGFAAAL